MSERIFEYPTQQPQSLPDLGQPMFLLEGGSVLLSHSKELVEACPPACNQHGVSHWPVVRVVAAHDVASGLAIRLSLGAMYGPLAGSEQGLAKSVIARLPAGSGVIGDRNFGVFSLAYPAHQHQRPCRIRLTEQRARKRNGGPPRKGRRTKGFAGRPAGMSFGATRRSPRVRGWKAAWWRARFGWATADG